MKNKITILLTLVLLLLNYNRIYSQTKSVWVDQKSFDSISIDSIGLYNLGQNIFDKYKAPQNFTWNIGPTQTLLGSQKLIDNQKYKHWENNFSPDNNVVNHKSFDIYSWTNNLTSKFHSTHPGITIKTSLEGLDLTGGGVIFKDPWFIDYQDTQYANQLRNRGMNEAYPHPRTSPFYPNATTTYEYGQTYRGVFLSQPIISGRPYYKVAVPTDQPITVHGQDRLFYPYYWTGDGVNYEDAYNNETGVVFTSSDAVAKAVLKGNLMSGDVNGISSNSQRKLVQIGTDIILVYESMDNVWCSGFGIGAAPFEFLLKENAKNPSIDYYDDIVSIVYEYLEGNSVYVSYIEMASNYNQIAYANSFLVSNNASDFGTIKPVVSSNEIQRLIVYKKSPTSNLKYRIRTFDDNTNTWVWGSSEFDIPDTDENLINPSIVGNKNIQEHHIVYQQGNSVIKYKHADYKDLDELRFCQDTVVSANCGFTINQNPSVSVAWDDPSHQVQISWQGIYHRVLDKIIAKEQEYGLWRYEAVTRLKMVDNSWTNSRAFGSNVKYVQSGSLNTTDGAIIAWSESNGLYSKYVKRNSGTNYSTTQNLSTNGIYTLVSNGDTFGDIKAVVFNNLTSAPFLLNKCTNDFSQIILSKDNDTEAIDISYGRAGVIGKENLEFLFNIGDVILNNKTIKFIEKNDTLPITSTDQLNQTVRTESFYLNPQSELMFSNYYYVVNKSFADSALSDQFDITFKCELVNEITNQVVGTFDNVTYSKFNVQEYANPSYLIDCSGIESGDYFLRLNTTVNEEVEFALSDIQKDNVTLEKQNMILRNFKGESIPVAFDLEQNYPNPFNPNTIIKYQLPQDGIVILKVYDILGSEVATLVNERKTSGRYEVTFNASSIASGVYIYRLQSGDYVSSKKMVLIK